MDISGIWKGEYRGSFEQQPTFLKSTFIMRITKNSTIDEHVMPAVFFEGICQHHPEGSNITQHASLMGSFINREIYFIQQFPKLMVQTPSGTIEQFDQPHPDIHYSGKFENGMFKGSWHVDPTFRKINGEIRAFGRQEGFWEMERI